MLGRTLRGAVAALALLAAASVTPRVAHATSFAELTIEQFTDASTWIVEGKVVEVWTELDTERSLVWTRARVDVSDVLKGADVPSQIIVDSVGGTVGDFSVHVPGQAVFSEGEDVFLFLDDLGGEGAHMVPVSKFLGKYTIRRAAGETRQHAMTWHPKEGVVFDARFLPHPDPEFRLYVDDLREQVRDRVEAGWDGKPIPGLSAERLQQINTLDVRMPR